MDQEAAAKLQAAPGGRHEVGADPEPVLPVAQLP